ncbi:MAG: hypothetical protein IT210_08130 [Armatimonadetes bacterium]|nr:hypothetical protein [Armatimonadota bacterium]
MEPIAGTGLCPGIAVGQAIVYEDAASLMKFARLEADSERILVSGPFVPTEIAVSLRVRIIGKAWDEELPRPTRSEIVPAVGALGNLMERAQDGDLLVVDGYRGMVYVNPDARVVARYQEEMERSRRPQRVMLEIRHIPAQTQDGRQIAFYADAAGLEEAWAGIEQGADGVALLRQEAILSADGLPLDVRGQEERYRQIGTDYGGKTIVVEGFNFHEDALRRQMESLLRSGDTAVFALTLPLEWGNLRTQEARGPYGKALHAAQQGRFVVRPLEIGAHLIAPAQLDEALTLIVEDDFLTIDADRIAEVLASWLPGAYPLLAADVLETLSAIAGQSIRYSKPVYLCGRMSITADILPVMIGLGWSRFGVAPEAISMMKDIVRAVSVTACKELADRIAGAASEEEAARLLLDFAAGPGGEV